MPRKSKEELREYHRTWRKENKEHCQNYQKERYENHIDEINIYGKKYREENKEHLKEYHKQYRCLNKEKIKKNDENLKRSAYKTIAEYRNSEIKCWKCEEDKWQCLTIAHLNNDGSEDRKQNGRGHTLYRAIINKKRTCDDLQLECYNCNNVDYHYGKYPSELKNNEMEEVENG